jgi:hypothetical protein
MTDASTDRASPADIENFSLFINELRDILELSILQPIDRGHIDSLRSQSSALLTQLRQHRQKRALPLYNVKKSDSPMTAKDCNDLQPYSPVSGALNPIAPPLTYRPEGDRLYSEITLGGIYEGPPKSVHGAVVTAIYDQLLAMANILSGSAGPTAWIKVNFARPTPLHVPLTFVAWKAEQEGRKVSLRGQCFANGELVSDCEGLFIKFVPPGVAEEIKR